jgi:DNA-binding protein H-NS
MLVIQNSVQSSTENNSSFRYSHQAFRPEAVEAYTMRQAGEPWDGKGRLENWAMAVLTVLSATAVVFVFLGVK